MKRKNVWVGGMALAAAAAALIGLGAQQPGFKRTLLQQADLSAAGREVVQVVAELEPGAQAGRHTHPGEEVGYVLEGAAMLEIEGRPAVLKKAGDAFIIPPGAIHNARNTGTAPAKILATYFIEKGKPVATPVQ